jgi:hypothetical protein
MLIICGRDKLNYTIVYLLLCNETRLFLIGGRRVQIDGRR